MGTGGDGSFFAPVGDGTSRLERFQGLVNVIDDGLYQLDTSGRFVAVNDHILERTNYDREELIGRHVSAILDEEQIERVERELERMVEADAEVVTVEVTAESADGEEIPYELRITPVVDAEGNLDGTVGVARDISDRMELERELEQRREQAETELAEIYGRITDGFYSLDQNWCFTYVNDRAAELIDFTGQGLEGESIWERFEWGADSVMHEQYTRAMESQEPISFEFYYPEPLEAWYEIHAYPSETGLSVYFRDISGRKEQEAALKRYETAVETVWDGVVTLDAADRFLMVNEAFCELSGYDREDLIGEHATLIMTESDHREATELHEAVQENDLGVATMEYELQTADGGAVPVEARFGPCELADGSIGGTGVIRDLSDRIERERELEQYQRIVEAVDDGVYVLDEDDRYLLVNEAYCEMAGYSRGELLGDQPSLIVDDDVAADAAERAMDLVGEEGYVTIETEVMRKDGDALPAEARFAPFTTDEGEYGGRLGVVRDVSERRQRERALEESERRYRTLAENFPAGAVALYDHDLRYIAAGGELLDEMYQEVGDPVGERITERYPDDVIERIEPHFLSALEGSPAEFEVTYYGRELAAETVPVRNGDDEVFAGMLIVRDITERREHERKLERTLDLLKRTERIADVGGWEIDPKTEEVFRSDRLFDILGVDPGSGDTTLDEALTIYHPEDRPQVERAIQQSITSGEPFDLEARLSTEDDEERWLHVQGVPRIEDGTVTLLRGAAQDVTARKERELELERYETIVETVNDGIYTVGPEGRFTWTNSRYAEMVGYDQDDLVGTDVSLVVAESVADQAQTIEADLVSGERRTPTMEAQLEAADGSTIPAEATFAVFESDDGYERVGVARDITERKQRERMLRRQREELAALNQLNDAIRDISHAVIETSSRDEIERSVVDWLADQYAFAWIGRAERGGDRITSRVTAGSDEETPGDREVTIAGTDEGECGPTVQAIETGAPQFLTGNRLDEVVRSRASSLANAEVNAIAAIPLTHEDRGFGVLTVYGEHEDDFDGPIGEILKYLGQVIAHALFSIDQRMALIGNSVVELELAIGEAPGSELVSVTAQEDATMSYERTIPLTGDRMLQFVTVRGLEDGAVQQLADELASVSAVRLIRENADRAYYEFTLDGPPLLSTVTGYGGRMSEQVIDSGTIRLRIELPRSAPIRDVVESIREIYPTTEVLAQRTTEREVTTSRELDSTLAEELTDRQRESLETAYFAGFFDWPRTKTGEEVAEILDLSPATFTEHLRVAERKIFGVMLEPESQRA